MVGIDLAAGMRAPDFRLSEASEEPFQLHEELKNNPVLLLFYPNDFGIICSLEMRTVHSMCSEISAKGIRVVGVSRNSPYTHRQWKENLGIPFRLLADEDGSVSRQYAGLLEDGLLKGLTRRAVFLVDRDARVQYLWVSHEEALPPPFEKIREAVSRFQDDPNTTVKEVCPPSP
ncbi:MAG: redoxin domain-containing protein [Methanomassiliicoccales archaeon]|nr:redoxin domain-containing protein [Methanomassiliicoccales archaeon]